MNKDLFVKNILHSIEVSKKDLEISEALAPLLPELPSSCKYINLEAFPIKSAAYLILRIETDTRIHAAELLKLFPAERLLHSPVGEPPFFRPKHAVQAWETSFTPVFPAIFVSYLNARLEPEFGRFSNRLVWYWQPFLIHPHIGVVISIDIAQDDARVFEDSEVNFPEGNKIVDTSVQTGFRTASVWWSPELEQSEWLRQFGRNAGDWDNWADVIDIDVE